MMQANQKSVNVKRTELLKKLKSNLAEHEQDHQEALVGYKIKLMKDLQATLKKVKAAEYEDLSKYSSLRFDQPPVSYSNEYREVIAMMEMSVDEHINLDSTSFKSYILNQWSWSNLVNSTNTLYKSIAASAK
jgi:hypothetical protein